MAKDNEGDQRLRRIHRVLVMHYIEGLSQAEIAKRTGLSHPMVNRLVKEGHERGYVRIEVKSPRQDLFELEQALARESGLAEAMVVPTASDQDSVNLQAAGRSVADHILTVLRDGDTICVSGGVGVSAVIEALAPTRAYDVTVVPATGGVQGKHFVDVNHLAAQLASKLQGRAFQIHAPIFAASRTERDVLMSLQSVGEVLDRARGARIALVGIGSVLSETSTYFSLHAPGAGGLDGLRQSRAAGELIAHLIDADGHLCDDPLNERVVALSPEELRAIPMTIGIAAGAHKAAPIAGILRGGYLDILATDEATGTHVLDILKRPT
ncbi:sugar-binding transcriptional regulator [Labrys sp. ZIDIC5]|uniref:sugar-binding transcriptional regulator n=1 Tax=Labrys sedimenti TaxID=3106036 RepID=UPI002ACA7432|nr:sugar-binding transcriptional regulator [Labrys sp. ZIDIC5]MDZ5450652.1 sugar-binding transcriptional regulator [Labrys sp. ZIDIC5]